jgi:hypothetical protein
MNVESIKRHLRPYSTVQRRATTVHHAFASAIAPRDEYDRERIVDALGTLGQDDSDRLACVYCGADAETWDHLHALVESKRFSGYGHTLGNLVPACKSCNSRKGNKRWRESLETIGASSEHMSALEKYALRQGAFSLSEQEMRVLVPAPFRRLDTIKEEILSLMKEAGTMAAEIRKMVSRHRTTQGTSH